MNERLKIIGKTVDNKPVLDGWFYFVSTVGLPIDAVIERLNQDGYMPYWLGFFTEATKEGWKPESTFTRLEEAVGDVYGSEFREAWAIKMRIQIQNLGLDSEQVPHTSLYETAALDDHGIVEAPENIIVKKTLRVTPVEE